VSLTRFPLDRVPPPVKEIAARLHAAGHEAWYVGGAVRDLLFETHTGTRPPRTGDFDIATSALPDAVRALFRRTVPIGIEHGTVAVLDDAGVAHEVTTFRKDVKTDGRHAVVEFGVSLEEDLARRDYTINAVAVHPETGELRDPFGGQADLARRLVRAVGDAPTRLREDRLRVLRALRFAAAFSFEIEPATWAAIVAAAGEVTHLSRERVRDEWLKMLATSQPSAGVGLWRRAGALVVVWPELASLPREREPWLDLVAPRDPVLLTAAALYHAGRGAAEADAACLRLRFSGKDSERVRAVVAGLIEGLPAGGGEPTRRWLTRHRAVWEDVIGASQLVDRREPARAAVREVLSSGAPLAVGELAIGGEDLKAAGIPPGPAMGGILRKLLEECLADPARNSRERLLARARELA